MRLILSWENGPGDKQRREFLAPATFIVGRTIECDLYIPDRQVSRRHCSIKLSGEGAEVADLGSANGTFLNGRAVRSSRLPPLAGVKVGNTEITVEVIDENKTDQAPTSKQVKLKDGAVVEIAGYSFVRCLGQGTYGAVWEARDERGLPIALKVMKARPELSDEDRHRFFREATTAGAIVHPNVVRVLDQGQAGPLLFIAMEFIRGETVRALLDREGMLPLARALEIARGVASALEAARRANLVHRDVKPDNILVAGGGLVKLVDFGFAKSMGTAGDSGLTKAGDVVGTLAYMSPEQLESSIYADHRSDIYSFGATLYHTIAGATPFRAKSSMDYFNAILNADPIPLETARPGIPRIVRNIVHRCLMKNPAERYQTAAEILRLLDPLLASGRDARTTDIFQ